MYHRTKSPSPMLHSLNLKPQAQTRGIEAIEEILMLLGIVATNCTLADPEDYTCLCINRPLYTPNPEP